MGEENEVKGEVTTPDTKEQTPEETPTLTQKQAEELSAKAVQATKTDYGRLEAELRRSQSIAESAIKRLKERDEEDYRRREEANQDNPDELTRIRSERKLREREAEIEERETKTKTRYEQIVHTTVKALVNQYSITEEMLNELAGDDVDKMEKVAKAFGERKPSGESEVKQVTRMTKEPDSGKTKGGGAGLTTADVKNMSPQERHERSKEIAAIPFS